MDTRGEISALTVTFRVAHLPRETKVNYPLQRETLLAGWQRRDEMFVVEQDEAIRGYVTLTAYAEHNTAWIGDLVVDRPHRRRGIGTLLLKTAAQWGHSQALGRLVLEMQTKNYPAIRFCQSRGLTFCGYNDHYWSKQDIALFFGTSLR